jgi:hypothetical protein
LDEFADMLTIIGGAICERLLICDDFNLAGNGPNNIDERLSSRYDTLGYQQHVNEPTRRITDNLLDLVVTPVSTLSSQLLVSGVPTVHSSHELSDHDLVVCNLAVWQYAVSYSFRNIRCMDTVAFQKHLLSSHVFTNPTDPPVGQMR